MKRKIRRIGIGLIVMIILINCFIQFIYVKEVTRFECKLPTDDTSFVCWTKESLLNWSEEAARKESFDVSELESDLKGIDDKQRLVISVGREISFFYRFRPCKPVEVKYKNDKVTNDVYVYKVNYKGSIIDYTVY